MGAKLGMNPAAVLTNCLKAKSGRSTRCYKRLNSAPKLIQRTTSEAPQRHYVLHRTGCSQEDDQLLREGRGWPFRLVTNFCRGSQSLVVISSVADPCRGSLSRIPV